MVTVTIDGKTVQGGEQMTILGAAKMAGIEIPTLCFLWGSNDIGACRVCLVEVEGYERLVTACNTKILDGMVIHTHTPRVIEARKENLRLIQARHDRDCCGCPRGDAFCQLKKLFDTYKIEADEYPQDLIEGKRLVWDKHLPIQKNMNRCILCGRCVQICNKVQGIGVWDYIDSGTRTIIGIRDGLEMEHAKCVSCGQCITHCPTGALYERDDIDMVRAAIADPEVTTVFQIAPACRTSWAITMGAEEGEFSVNRMAAALKAMGADYVFDTCFSADLTIMEEGTELVQRLVAKAENPEAAKTDGIEWPMFTSCCPGWVTHACRSHEPVVAANLSSAKSPMQMFGASIKSWWAPRNNLEPSKVVSVAIMPCTAKKNEVEWPGMNTNAQGVPDMDFSLTTREFARMVKTSGIDVRSLDDIAFDDPFGEYTGAGVIFGATGGVMEAALRSAYFLVTGEECSPDAFVFKRSNYPWTEFSVELKGIPVRCAVANSLTMADKLIEAVKRGEVVYDFVEVMACPNGCAGGGGQPIDGTDRELGADRGNYLHFLDKNTTPLRRSHENPDIQRLYQEWLGEPCSHLAHEHLHTEPVAYLKD